MIILSSPPSRKYVRVIFLCLTILAALGVVFTGVAAFSQLPDAWGNPDRAALYVVIGQIATGLLGIIGATWQITQQLTIGDPLQRLVATEETLAIKTRNKPILFLKRRDCIALAVEGKALVMADGKAHAINAYGAIWTDVETFVDSLYDLWWPGLRRAEVKEYLAAITPPRPKWRAMPLLFLLVTFLFIPTFSMWKSVLIPISLSAATSVCFIYLTVRLAIRRDRQANTVRYPLVEFDGEPNGVEWSRPHESLDLRTLDRANHARRANHKTPATSRP